MTCKQLNSIYEEDGTHKLDEQEVSSVRIVGTIISIESHATNVVYKVSDGSGTVECKAFVDKEAKSPKFPDCVERSLVCCNGNIRSYEGNKSIMIYSMYVVRDWNQLTQHLLECIHVHLKNTRGPVGANAQSPSALMGMNMSAPTGAGLNRNDFGGNMTNNNAQSDLRESILRAYQSVGDPDIGPDFNQVMVALANTGNHISMHQLKQEVEYLCGEGQLYTTIDEFHYKPTL